MDSEFHYLPLNLFLRDYGQLNASSFFGLSQWKDV